MICNSGVANVATGEKGVRDAMKTCRHVGRILGCLPTQVIPASTGVIGPALPMARLLAGVDDVIGRLGRGPRVDAACARAIMTTDTVPKQAHRRLARSTTGKSGVINLGGVAKGSGMIAPDMATMLSFITTDAPLSPALLRRALRLAVEATFNRISIDGDTSTSDMVIILANGAAECPALRRGTPAFEAFVAALADLCAVLAAAIITDGEGATRTMRVVVQGAASSTDADRIGRTIVNSPLIKTALHGSDPNWGRLVMAVGRSGARILPDRLGLTIGRIPVLRRGSALKLDAGTRRKLAATMRQREVLFQIDVGAGRAVATWLGCDLSKKYVDINALYTT